MVGHGPLEAVVLVRIQARELYAEKENYFYIKENNASYLLHFWSTDFYLARNAFSFFGNLANAGW